LLGTKITTTSKSSLSRTSPPSKGRSRRKKQAQPHSISLSTSLSLSLSPISRPREEKVEERPYLAGSGDEASHKTEGGVQDGREGVHHRRALMVEEDHPATLRDVLHAAAAFGQRRPPPTTAARPT
jgi:hypothetical protein